MERYAGVCGKCPWIALPMRKIFHNFVPESISGVFGVSHMKTKRIKCITILVSLLVTISLSAQRQYNIGITLSGGGARGFAHIGVLQALEDYGVHPEIVSGTSMGALVGAMYANGMTPEDIFEMVKREELDRMASFVDISSRQPREHLGISTQNRLHRILIDYLPHNSFDSLQIPFYLCMSNICDGKEVVVHSGGNLVECLRGSSCIPGFFEPVLIDSAYYVDGGLYNNLPVQPIRKQCKILIAVDVNPKFSKYDINKIGDVLSRSVSLIIYENTKEGRKMCDYVISVPVSKNYSTMDFDKFYAIYQMGYMAGLEFIKSHPEIPGYSLSR